jgi:HD superfamily phosphohydrolase
LRAVPPDRKAPFATAAARDAASSDIALSEVSRIGRPLGEFTIESSLGSGRYSETYLVRSRDGEQFAAKCLRSDCPADGPARMMNEAWALRTLREAHVITIPSFVALGHDDDAPYLVMTVAPGESLDQLFRRNLSEGHTLGQRKTMRIIAVLLQTLVRIHAAGISHRDIQLGNVVVERTDAPEFERIGSVTLIDFGTVHADDRPHDVPVFWNEGTSRFSPPDKLRHPARAIQSQDTFAVGVLAYVLMTNAFPWSVDDRHRRDRGDLEELMRSTVPRPIHDVDPAVARELSNLVAALLTPNDGLRPSAEDALAELQRIERLSEYPEKQARSKRSYAAVIADPVHGNVTLTAFELELIRSRDVQRLSRIRQLGLAHLIYPGAVHDLFQHGLGTMHVMSTIMRRYEERADRRVDADDWLAARCFALVKNVATLPFGNLLDTDSGVFRAEPRLSAKLREFGELGNLLQSESFGPIVHDLAEGRAQQGSWIGRFFDDACGPDVLDAVARNAHFAGVSVEKLDPRVYDAVGLAGESWSGAARPRLDVDEALWRVLLQRYRQFELVHSQKRKVAADAMVAKAVWLATSGQQPELRAADVARMADEDALFALSRCRDPLARQLATGVRERQLWKTAFSAAILPSQARTEADYHRKRDELAAWGLTNPEGRDRIEKSIARRLGLRTHDIIFHCSSEAPGLQRLLRRPRGEHRLYGELIALHLGLWRVRGFVAPRVSADSLVLARVVAACEDFLRYVNDLEEDS